MKVDLTLPTLVGLVVLNFILWFYFLLGCLCLILEYCCLRIMSFLLKNKPFPKMYLIKIYFKNSFRVLRIKISFPLEIYFKNSFRVLEIEISFSQIMCNHVLIGLHLSQFSIKATILSKTQIQACGPK